MIHGHGNNLLAYGRTIRLDFSSNIAFNHHGDRIIGYLREHLQTQLGDIANYPDPQAMQLTHKLAEHHNLSPQHVLVTNGSAEAFYLIAHYLTRTGSPCPAGPQTAICIPAFAEYEDACALYNHRLTFLPLKEFQWLDCSSLTSVWLGNPNNPNGVITPPGVILEKSLSSPDTIFVLDQAYVQLTSRKDIDILNFTLPDNLIITHSLTKEFAIPGLRLGYITAPPAIIERLSAMRPPWSVNSLALSAGAFIIDNYHSLLPNSRELVEESHFLQQNFATIKGLEVLPSPCNFFLSRLNPEKGTAAMLKQKLIDAYGILIRDASNFRGLGPHYFRVAAQKRADNNQLIAAISSILRTGHDHE